MQLDFRCGKLYEIVLDFVEAGLGFLCGMCLAFTNAMPFEIPKMSNACLRYENTIKTANLLDRALVQGSNLNMFAEDAMDI